MRRLVSLAACMGGIAVLSGGCGANANEAQAPRVGVVVNAIVGGKPAAADAYPWFAYIYLTVEGTRYPACGGMLIDERHVVTAAHCAIQHELDDEKHQVTELPREAAAFSVAMRPQALSEVADVDLIAVKQVSIPRGFADDLTGVIGDAVDEDLAVLELERPVYLDKYPRIASEHELADLTEHHATVRTIGFGLTDAYGDETSDILNQVDVRLVSNETCAEQYEDTSPVTDAMLCAGWSPGGRDSCAGDSGGPIFYENSAGEPLLLGVVSWGTEVVQPAIIPCGSPDYASVYTNLAHFHDYIDSCLAACCEALSSKVICDDGYADADAVTENGCEQALAARN